MGRAAPPFFTILGSFFTETFRMIRYRDDWQEPWVNRKGRLLLLKAAAGMLCVALAQLAVADDLVFFSSPDFTVTEADARLYLRAEEGADGEIRWGSPERVRQGLSELLVLKALSSQGNKQGLLTEEEKNWIAYYAVAIETTRRFIASEANRLIDGLDWQQEARDYYVANREEFMRPESLKVQTLLLKTDTRSYAEAIELAEKLAPAAMSIDDFSAVVVEHTEDTGNANGVIEQMFRGQMVGPFEDAAFSLENVGDMSGPVVSPFGVHVVQLLGRTPESYRPLSEVESELIAKLTEIRRQQAASLVRSEPHRSPPKDFVSHDEVIEQFLTEVATQHQASLPQLPTID